MSDLPAWVRPTSKAAIGIARRLVCESGVVLTISTPYGPVRVEDELDRLLNAMPDYLTVPPDATP